MHVLDIHDLCISWDILYLIFFCLPGGKTSAARGRGGGPCVSRICFSHQTFKMLSDFKSCHQLWWILTHALVVVGADIRSVCAEAGTYAVRARRKAVTDGDFLDAVDKSHRRVSENSVRHPKRMIYTWGFDMGFLLEAVSGPLESSLGDLFFERHRARACIYIYLVISMRTQLRKRMQI